MQQHSKEYFNLQDDEEDLEKGIVETQLLDEKQNQDSDDCYSVLYLCDSGMDEFAISLDFFHIIRKKETNSRYKFKLAKPKNNHDDLSLLNSIQFIDVKSEKNTYYPLRIKEWKDFIFRDKYCCFLIEESKTKTQIANDEWIIQDFTLEKLPPDGFYSIRETNHATTYSTTLFNIYISHEREYEPSGSWVNKVYLRIPIAELRRIGEQSKIKLSSILRYIQKCYDLQNFEKELCNMRESFFRNDYFEKEENLLEPKLLFPLFHLFALRDMRFEHVNDSIEILTKIGEQADKIWNYLIELPSQSLDALKKYEQMWNDSLKEAEENGILQHSIVFILRNQITNRTVSQLSIRYFFIDLGISCSIMKNNEMFMDVIILSNLLYNWNKFGK